MLLYGTLLGALFGFGLLLLLRPAASRPTPAPLRALHLRASRLGPQGAVGVAAGVALTLLTGWPVLGVAGGFLAAQVIRGLMEGLAERQALARRKALAEVASGLRDSFAAGLGLPQAVDLAARTGPAELKAELEALAGAVKARGVERAFEDYAEVAPDPIFRVFASTVSEAYRAGSEDLGRLLGKLAEATSREVATAKEMASRQGFHRLAAGLVAGASVVVLVWLRVQSPQYAGAYDDATGQLFMALGFAPILAGYFLLLRVRRAHEGLSWLGVGGALKPRRSGGRREAQEARA